MTSHADRERWIVRACVACALGTLVVAVGEFLMLYAPGGGYTPAEGHRNFAGVSPGRSTLGFYLGVLGVPIYLLGYWQIARALEPAGRRLASAVRWLGSYCTVIGNVWLGSNAYLAAVVRERERAPTEFRPALDRLVAEMDALADPLLQIIRTILLAVSLLYVYGVLTGRSDYPRWMAIFSPFLLLVLIFACYLAAPAIGQYIVPDAMNVAHCAFFTLSAFALGSAYARRRGPEAAA